MSGIDSILCVLDPAATAGCASLEKAVRLANVFDAALELLICSVPPWPPEDDGGLSCRLEELAQPLRERCRGLSTRLIVGETLHQSLLSYIGGANFDLVVKEAYPGRSFGRPFGLCTDSHLIRACATPLLLTHARPWPLEPTILACIDPGHPGDPRAILDHCILQGAQAFSRKLGGTLHALHAYCHQRPYAISGGGSFAEALALDPMEHETVPRLANVGELAEEYQIGGKQVHLRARGARESIVREALDLRADIVVMGAVSRKNPLGALLGHTAERVLDRLRCDALVVKIPRLKWPPV